MEFVQIRFVTPQGVTTPVDAQVGRTLMQVALEHRIEGIQAECGGQCSCATCHCYVDQAWVDRLAPKSASESDLIDFVWEPKPNSRLACQLQVTPDLQGLTVVVPAQQL